MAATLLGAKWRGVWEYLNGWKGLESLLLESILGTEPSSHKPVKVDEFKHATSW